MSDAAGAGAQSGSLRELTFRAVLLGGLITLVFTAANVYLGLRVGLTFATSIPAAVISMAVLRMFRGSNILENNIVQTIASAAGTLAAIIFVLPGLVIIGWWQGFPYWTTALATATGGILGVMFSIPLRRALVVDTSLPYPEGVAAAEVLKVGAGSREGDAENRIGLRLIILNSLAAGIFTLVAKTRLLAEEVAYFFHVGPSSTAVAGGLSYALFGAGHLVGPLGRHGQPFRPDHRLVDPAADPDFRDRGSGGRGGDRHLPGRCALFWRRRDRCRRDLDPASGCSAPSSKASRVRSPRQAGAQAVRSCRWSSAIFRSDGSPSSSCSCLSRSPGCSGNS